MRATVEQRFWNRVTFEPNSGCWLWLGGCISGGYGLMWDGQNNVLAHRYSYSLHRGDIPVGLQLGHRCRVRCCVNPDHLEPVSARENTMRGFGIAAINSRKTHCSRGHAYTDESTYFQRRKDGSLSRHCRECWEVLKPVKAASLRAARRMARENEGVLGHHL